MKTMKNHKKTMKNHEKPGKIMNQNEKGEGCGAGINKNVSNAGSQLTWEGGRAGIHKNVTYAGSQLTFEKGEGCGAGITEKRDPRGVTTDLLDV